jgi:ABC-type Zn2+ transport system substrate-binding protein/surface adhesin
MENMRLTMKQSEIERTYDVSAHQRVVTELRITKEHLEASKLKTADLEDDVRVRVLDNDDEDDDDDHDHDRDRDRDRDHVHDHDDDDDEDNDDDEDDDDDDDDDDYMSICPTWVVGRDVITSIACMVT